MLAGLRHRLTYANAMATVAVLLALGGGAYAATSLPRNSVGTKQLKDGAVTKPKLAIGVARSLGLPPSASASVDRDASPVSLTVFNPTNPTVVLQTTITTKARARITANAVAGIESKASNVNVDCRLTIARSVAGASRTSMSQLYELSMASPSNAVLPVGGAAVEPAGRYVVRLGCFSLGGTSSTGDARFHAGDITVGAGRP